MFFNSIDGHQAGAGTTRLWEQAWSSQPVLHSPISSPARQWASSQRWEGESAHHVPIYTGLMLTMIIWLETRFSQDQENRTLQPVLSGSSSYQFQPQKSTPDFATSFFVFKLRFFQCGFSSVFRRVIEKKKILEFSTYMLQEN